MSESINSEQVVPPSIIYDGNVKDNWAMHSSLKPWKFKENPDVPYALMTDVIDNFEVGRIMHPIFGTTVMTDGLEKVLLVGFYVELKEYKIGEVFYVPLEYMFGKHQQITLEYLFT